MKFIKLPIKQRIDPYYFALEEYLLNQEIEAVFIWDVYPSVIVGKNQIIENEVHLDYLKKHNIKVYRRPSGGGAVYNDYGCIKYSFISKKPKEAMYEVLLGMIKDFLKPYIDTSFSGRNDLTYQEMKFSGNAYYQTKKGHVLHGTILYDTDLTVLSQVLNPSKLKLQSKGVSSVKSRVTNLKEPIGLSREQFRRSMDDYFSQFETIVLDEKAHQEVLKLMDGYLSDDYIYGHTPKYAISSKERFPFGEVELFMEVKNNRIVEVAFYGDFFQREDIKLLIDQLIGLDMRQLDKILTLDPSCYIEGMRSIDLYNLVRKGF